MRYILSKEMRRIIASSAVIITILMTVTGCDDEKSRVKSVEKYIHQLKLTAQKSKQPVNEVTLQLPNSAVYGESPAKKQDKRIKPTNDVYVNPLQAYSVNRYQFVGILDENNSLSAYLLAPDGLIYQVKVGDVIGDNYGKISKIDLDHLTVVEQAVDRNKKVEQQSITLELKDDQDEQS